MKHFALILICTPLSGALRYVGDLEQKSEDKNSPITQEACGAMMVGAGSDKYVLNEMKIAQRLAMLKMTAGWCKHDAALDHLPVVYFHDRNLTTEDVRKALDGAEPLFEMFYIGTPQRPAIDQMEAIPKMFENYYKWYRPQLFQFSPFKTTLSLDGDAVPCNGAKLSLAFNFHSQQNKHITATKHMEGINMGFVIFETEPARPWAAAWSSTMKECIHKHGMVNGDQNSMKTALSKNKFSIAIFSDHNICRRAVRTKGCATESCWVDHRPGHADSEASKVASTELTKDEGEGAGGRGPC